MTRRQILDVLSAAADASVRQYDGAGPVYWTGDAVGRVYSAAVSGASGRELVVAIAAELVSLPGELASAISRNAAQAISMQLEAAL